MKLFQVLAHTSLKYVDINEYIKVASEMEIGLNLIARWIYLSPIQHENGLGSTTSRKIFVSKDRVSSN